MASKKYILISTGGDGVQWCRNILPRLQQMGKAEPAAVVDMNFDVQVAAEQYLGLAKEHFFQEPLKAFENRLADFAIILSPPGTHERLIELALIHGLDVLCDTPISDTMQSVCRIYRKVAAAEAKMAVLQTERFDQDKQTLEYLVTSKDYGPLNYVVMRYTNNLRRRASGRAFWHEISDPLIIEAGGQHFDLFRGLAGANCRSIYASSWNPIWGEFRGDSTAIITLEMENGIHCVYEGAMANRATMNCWGEEYVRAECEGGTLELDRRKLRLLQSDATSPPTINDLPMLEQEAWSEAWLVEQFVDWLVTDNKPPFRLSDNIQVQAMVFAAVESARTGKRVDVQPYLKTQLQMARQNDKRVED